MNNRDNPECLLKQQEDALMTSEGFEEYPFLSSKSIHSSRRIVSACRTATYGLAQRPIRSVCIREDSDLDPIGDSDSDSATIQMH